MSPTARRLLMALCLLATAGFARLGFWQLGRLEQRRASNRLEMAARGAPVIPLTGDSLPLTDSLGGRRVSARGRYDGAHDIVVRGGALQGVPGVYMVTPLRLSGSGVAVLVERGFVPSVDATTVDVVPLAEPGEVTVRGIARSLSGGGGRPLVRPEGTTWAKIDLDALRPQLPYQLLPISIRQTPDPGLPSFPRRLDPPEIDDGPHLSYAIQWFLFAALAAGFAFLVIGRQAGSRRGP